MAFNDNTDAGKLKENIGTYSQFVTGSTTMSSGQGTAIAVGLRILQGITGTVRGATGVGEDVICLSHSGNTALLETVAEGGSKGGSSVVDWIAWGIPAA